MVENKKLCRDCLKELDKNPDNFYVNKDCKDGLMPNCKVCYKVKRKSYYYSEGGKAVIKLSSKVRRQELKRLVINYYGGMCACCGEKEISFLAIDHINGGGTKHRKSIGSGGTVFYHWLKMNSFPDGYQVLCHNCNFGRHINNGICPHKL